MGEKRVHFDATRLNPHATVSQNPGEFGAGCRESAGGEEVSGGECGAVSHCQVGGNHDTVNGRLADDDKCSFCARGDGLPLFWKKGRCTVRDVGDFEGRAAGKSETIAGYDLWAGSYDAIDNPLIAMVDRALELEPLEVAGKRVLELGCGTGRLAERFLQAGAANYTGVDGSAGMLGRAREHYQDAPAAWVEADLAGEIPLAEGFFEVVVISLVLEHFSEIQAVLRNAARLMAPGGVLRILELHAARQRAGTAAHFLHEGQDVRLPSYPHDAEEFRAELAPAGFGEVRIVERVPDEETLARSPRLEKYRGHGPAAGCAGSCGRETVMQRLRRRAPLQ